MPSTTMSIYVNDEDWNKFIKNRAFLNDKARDVIKEELKKIGDE